MNKKVKMLVFIASIILTLATLHFTVGKCHNACFDRMEMRHCGFEQHHGCCDKAPAANQQEEGTSSTVEHEGLITDSIK